MRRSLLSILLSMCFLFQAPDVGYAMSAEYNYIDVKNPVYVIANDPYVVRKDDRYYYCFSDYVVGIRVKEISNLDEITTPGGKLVWRPERTDTMYAKEIWAPELHYVDGDWYIYFAASDNDNANHRMYVLKGTSQDPTEPVEFVGKLTDASDHWCIDGTTFLYRNERYFVWSGWEGDEDGSQELYIAHMDSPVSIDSDRVCISKPDLSWEQTGMPIEEGPAVIADEENEKITLVFSASGSWTDDYCMGKLELTGDADPMKPESWRKHPEPIFTKKEGAYGPGHCCFTEADDGSLWMIYHCNRLSGTGWDGRSCWIQPVSYENGELSVDGPVVPDEKMRLPVRKDQ